MAFVKQTIGRSSSASGWPVLGFVLALVVALGSGEVASAATSRTINLNTGFDQWASPPALIPVSGFDNEWRVTVDPTPGNVAPPERPAVVVTDSPGWFNPATTPPYNGSQGSRWISINPNRVAALAPPTSYQYAYYFTLPPGFTAAQLTMNLNAADSITQVTLNNSCPPLFSGSGGAVNSPPLQLTSSLQSCFTSGSTVNVLTVTVNDTAGGSGFTGLIVNGTVTYDDCDRTPVRLIPGLESITFFEATATGGPSPIQLVANSAAPLGTPLTTRITGSLGSGTGMSDFQGAPAEFYDVFYSTWSGTFDYSGEFVTIEAMFPLGLSSGGGGLNIAAVQLNFAGGQTQLADFVSSFVALGDNALPLNVGMAVDTSTGTTTTMGNTGQTTQRLRVTVGFPCCTPRPSGMVAWWPLDETSGFTVADIVGNHDGTAIGPNAINAAGCCSIQSGALRPETGIWVNAAFHFVPSATNAPAPSGWVSVPPHADFDFGMSGNFSIDAWVNRFDKINVPIVDKLDPTGPKTGYILDVFNDPDPLPPHAPRPRLRFVIGAAEYMSPPNALSQHSWDHVAVTVDRSTTPFGTVTLYINGTVVLTAATLPPGANATSTRPLLIGGKQPDSTVPYSAEYSLDEIEIFNRVLSQTEIQSIYNARSAGKCKVLPVPIAPTSFGCPPAPTAPVLSITPANAQPLFVSKPTPSTARAGLAFNAFAGQVDIYAALATPLPPPLNFLFYDGTPPGGWVIQPFPVPLPSLRAHSAAAVNMTTPPNDLFDVPLGLIPPGTYTFYEVVLPAGTNPATFNLATSSYYLWCNTKTFP